MRCAAIFRHVAAASYQTMSYENQLAMKETQIRELLEDALVQGGQVDENGLADFEWEGIHGSPIGFGYRNKDGIFLWR